MPDQADRMAALRAGLAEIKARVDAGDVAQSRATQEADMLLLAYIADAQ